MMEGAKHRFLSWNFCDLRNGFLLLGARTFCPPSSPHASFARKLGMADKNARAPRGGDELSLGLLRFSQPSVQFAQGVKVPCVLAVQFLQVLAPVAPLPVTGGFARRVETGL